MILISSGFRGKLILVSGIYNLPTYAALNSEAGFLYAFWSVPDRKPIGPFSPSAVHRRSGVSFAVNHVVARASLIIPRSSSTDAFGEHPACNKAEVPSVISQALSLLSGRLHVLQSGFQNFINFSVVSQ